ncbi:MAG: DUF3656 domain-containing protein, partial [Clostridia bacterium]|nr:DUF3656 domain-containing protein [Clostridia bacterium]
GRMKRPEYVAAATAACRSAVDSHSVPQQLADALKGVFSRSGFTDGYYKNALGRDMFGIRTKDDVNESKDTFALLHQLYRTERQSVEIEMKAEFIKGKPARLTVSCGDVSVEATGEAPQAAQSRATDKEELIGSLGKLGSTPYYCKKIDIVAEGDIFVRNSQVNQLRRDALEKLSRTRAACGRADIAIPHITAAAPTKKAEQKLIARIYDSALSPAAAEADLIAFPTELDIPDIAPEKLVAELPRWIESEESLRLRLAEIKAAGICKALCGNLSAVAIAKEMGFEIIGGIGLNIFNDTALASAKDMGVHSAVISAEATAAEARYMASDIPIGLFAYGRLPLMLLKNCPLKNALGCAKCDKAGFLTDRMGIKFPVRCRGGYSELLNSTPIFLADKLSDLQGVDMLYLHFTDEDAEQIRNVILAYKQGGRPPADFTRGLTFRPSL